MAIKALSPDFAVSPQLSPADVNLAAEQGYRSIISNRPDGEEASQPTANDMAKLADRYGLGFAHMPVVPGAVTVADADSMREAMAGLDGPVLAFCRSGARAATLWAMLQARSADADAVLRTTAAAGYDLEPHKAELASERHGSNGSKTYEVVIVGGGAAGIATAASLLKRNNRLAIAIIDPAEYHYYQPGWTMVGAGIFTPEYTRRRGAKVMPDKVDWLRVAATGFAPDRNVVTLDDGRSIPYRVLVVAPGITLAWHAIPGLAETLGKNGVTSNYRYDLAPYTRDLVRDMKGGRALFSQPAMPIKCAGAPQKAMYLSCDIWRKAGVLKDIEVEFHNASAALFGVAAYVPALMEYIRKYGIDLRLGSKLVSVDGPSRIAIFEHPAEDGSVMRIARAFDMLHAVPPQIAPAFVSQSPLAAESGFVDVDPATLCHVRYPNVFALGDAANTSNAKTAAAARKQAPVVAINVLATLADRALVAAYGGYGSCPLTVERGKIVLAEFGYGGQLLPSFPAWLIDGTRPSKLAWFLKERILPPIYWQAMLKGREWMARPHKIDQAA